MYLLYCKIIHFHSAITSYSDFFVLCENCECSYIFVIRKFCRGLIAVRNYVYCAFFGKKIIFIYDSFSSVFFYTNMKKKSCMQLLINVLVIFLLH